MAFQIEYINPYSKEWKAYNTTKRDEDAAKSLARILSQEGSDWRYRVVDEAGQQVWPEQAEEGDQCQAEGTERKK